LLTLTVSRFAAAEGLEGQVPAQVVAALHRQAALQRRLRLKKDLRQDQRVADGEGNNKLEMQRREELNEKFNRLVRRQSRRRKFVDGFDHCWWCG
jgi:hypothetical protein